MSITAENVHESSGVLDSTVTVASGRLSAGDEAKFTLMCLLQSVLPVRAHQAACLLSLFHALVVGIKAWIGVFDDEGAGH